MHFFISDVYSELMPSCNFLQKIFIATVKLFSNIFDKVVFL